jgi:hypothetical protein
MLDEGSGIEAGLAWNGVDHSGGTGCSQKAEIGGVTEGARRVMREGRHAVDEG